MTSAEYPITFWILGTNEDRQVGDSIVTSTDSTKVKNLMGQTDLPILVGLLKKSHLLLANDSGPMHIAAALEVPTVTLFGPTDPAKTGPFGKKHKVFQSRASCSPCFERKCPLKDQICFFDNFNSISIRDYIISQLNLKYRKNTVD